jgi:hypothetical protein
MFHVGGEFVDKVLIVTGGVQSTKKLQPSCGGQSESSLCLYGVFEFVAWWLLVRTPVRHRFHVGRLKESL